MARKRKRKSLPPTDEETTKRTKEKKLHEGTMVDGLDPPNHMVPLDELNTLGEDFSFLIGAHFKWPMVRLMMESRTGMRLAGVFVDEFYGEDHWGAWADHPPTWMDPHLFVRLCDQEPKIARICAIAFRKNDPTAWKRLMPYLSKVFDEHYLPLIIEKFEEDAHKLIAQWILRRFASKKLDEPQDKKKKKRKST